MSANPLLERGSAWSNETDRWFVSISLVLSRGKAKLKSWQNARVNTRPKMRTFLEEGGVLRCFLIACNGGLFNPGFRLAITKSYNRLLDPLPKMTTLV